MANDNAAIPEVIASIEISASIKQVGGHGYLPGQPWQSFKNRGHSNQLHRNHKSEHDEGHLKGLKWYRGRIYVDV